MLSIVRVRTAPALLLCTTTPREILFLPPTKNNNPKSTTRTMRVMRAPLACPAASLVIVAPPNPD
jgi:hypothetical protein